MATYAEAATPDSQARKTAKPVFLKEFDFFGVKKPPREQWISGVELYKSDHSWRVHSWYTANPGGSVENIHGQRRCPQNASHS